MLANVGLPPIRHDIDDVTCWDSLDRGEFSVRQVYTSLVGHLDTVTWANSVWFKGHIPKHSFCMWVACMHRLPTQDRIAEWKHDPPDLLCSLCGLMRDSHDHLFFECTFSRQERNLLIVLRHERKWYVLEEPLGEAPPANSSAAIRNAYQKRSDDLLDVGCLMLATMSPELQTGLMNTNAYDMIRQLRDMFQTQARTERYDATRALSACKMAKGTSVSAHVMKMKWHIDHLERLGHPVPLQFATDTILNSLSDDYKQFVINYNMNNMEKTIAELHSMLKTAELSMGTKTKDVLMVKEGGVKKKRGHRNTNKGKDQVQVSQSVPKTVDNGKSKGKGKKVKVNKARTENRCFRCHEVGHWRQNCPKRHETGMNTSDIS
ncbi:hypothetical protein OSB04_028336 [Centaurea solstitialis]|uniref:CCHC-type domain-containing protein n=1 Tax=Centaurea solstitialis TaxID=347529 RepID=A0AA38SFJ7_9ASTR|nr:hypothetical protein OSB04_028336 [Centaurea solstitialis]